MTLCNAAKGPMEANLKLMKDDSKEDADETTFKQIIGSLQFLCNNRPDLTLCVGLISRFMNKPKKSHMLVAKRVLRYIQGISNHDILFPTGRKKTELEMILHRF